MLQTGSDTDCPTVKADVGPVLKIEWTLGEPGSRDVFIKKAETTEI